MIHFRHDNSVERDDEPSGSSAPVRPLAERTSDFFRPGGRLERGCAGGEFPFEHRPQQERMAMAVAHALAEGRHLAVEAGTGVGKSYAYLAPLVLAVRDAGNRAVVSTYTISLQEQLMGKDVPFLRKHLGVEFKACLVKGRGNYLCRRRLARSRQRGGDLFRPFEQGWMEQLVAWTDTAEEGTLQELKESPPAGVWDSVCAEEGNCLAQKCPEFRRCFLMNARRRADEADLLVANHHLLFADLALRRQEVSLLPDYAGLVLDEAHQVEGVAAEHLGLRLSHGMFEHWLRRLHVPETGKGWFAALKDGAGADLVRQVRDGVDRLYAALQSQAGFDATGAPRVFPTAPEAKTDLLNLADRLAAHVQELSADLKDPECVAELRAARRRGLALRESLDAFLRQSLEDQVYWAELEGRRRQLVLYSAPVEVGLALRTLLFEAIPTVVLTSATLAVGGSLDYMLGRLGASGTNCDALSVGSPFDYGRQMRVLIPRHLSDPAGASERFVREAATAIQHFTRLTSGSAFVLFTAAAMMRNVAALVREPLAQAGLRLMVQGEGLSRHAMLEEFRKGGGVVLFGLDSFWMGVDVRGEALTNVIIARLPFAVPDHPLVQARMDRIRKNGGDAFRDYSLPEAVIKFRQGVGRLIRTAQDRGIVVVLDRRIVTKGYGRWFLRSLPECPVEQVDVPGLGPERAGETGDPDYTYSEE